MRLTKRNPETGQYEYKEKAKTQAEFIAQRKAVIQKLGEYEDRAEGHWIVCGAFDDFLKCSVCGDDHPWQTAIVYKYCPNCGAKMKGENDEQRYDERKISEYQRKERSENGKIT